MASPDPKTSVGAEAFVVQVLTEGEVYRRRHRNELGLPGEVHEVHTTYRELAEFRCKGCRRWSQLEPPMRYNEGPHGRQCAFCGDHTVVRFYA